MESHGPKRQLSVHRLPGGDDEPRCPPPRPRGDEPRRVDHGPGVHRLRRGDLPGHLPRAGTHPRHRRRGAAVSRPLLGHGIDDGRRRHGVAVSRRRMPQSDPGRQQSRCGDASFSGAEFVVSQGHGAGLDGPRARAHRRRQLAGRLHAAAELCRRLLRRAALLQRAVRVVFQHQHPAVDDRGLGVTRLG